MLVKWGFVVPKFCFENGGILRWLDEIYWVGFS
jgi:hypothetical protein